LGAVRPFLSEMVRAVRDLMEEAYPDLVQSTPYVMQVIQAEETRFHRTLEIGSRKLDEALVQTAITGYEENRSALQGIPGLGGELQTITDAISDLAKRNVAEVVRLISRIVQKHLNKSIVFPGKHIFQLYDTFGLPTDFMRDVIRDEGFGFDEAGFESAMQ